MQSFNANESVEGGFRTTRWSVVLEARHSPDDASTALETLCRTYWYPLYAFVRRAGHDPHSAQDLTQEFFARFLAKNYLSDVSPEKGKFRSFLLAALKHFLADEWDKAQTAKRGGGQPLLSLDDATAEARYRLEPSHDLTPDKIFDRRWALTLLEQVLTRLEAEFVDDGKKEMFEELQVFLLGKQSAAPYAQAASRLGMTEGAVKVAAHRLRRRYRELLRLEIAHTVESAGEIEGELRDLLAALR
ncbi:MAG: sigma-70 family RNA polymerase sigma factor [Chloroflexi bacterium]|nr:sigma-70 family RNA polymerase sigma factor [Chloroflexota bacterium]